MDDVWQALRTVSTSTVTVITYGTSPVEGAKSWNSLQPQRLSFLRMRMRVVHAALMCTCARVVA